MILHNTSRTARSSVRLAASAAALLALTLFLLAWLISTTASALPRPAPRWSPSGCWRVRVQSLTGVQAIFESGQFIDDLDGFLTLAPAARRVARNCAPRTSSHPGRCRELLLSRSQRAALQAASIEINRGEVVALVGENGSGKTTLAKVMAGLYEPGSGAVRWDGTDIRTFRPDLFRERVAIIFQDFVRYALSAEENIAGAAGRRDRPCGDPRGGQDRRCGFVPSALPAGYQTPLSRRFTGGHELSGANGRRWRLPARSIATRRW